MNFISTKNPSQTTFLDDFVDITQLHSERTLKVCAVFAGCGGFSLGMKGDFTAFGDVSKTYFEKNNFDIAFSNEIEPNACKTYRDNFGTPLFEGDITELSTKSIPDFDILIGGFPCQDFSISGRLGGLSVERGRLYREMIRILSEKKPIGFIAENVKNLANPKLVDPSTGKPVIDTIISEFANEGYRVKYGLMHGPTFGLPQNRERIFIFGIRKDLELEPKFPYPIFPRMTTKQAIDDIWDIEKNAHVPNQTQISLAKFKQPTKTGNQGNYKLKPDQPSYVMRAEHHMNIQAHYRTHNPSDPGDRSAWRRMTVREAARVQSFPDDFVFSGTKFWAYKQVGNAVPPMLGWYAGRALYNSIYPQK